MTSTYILIDTTLIGYPEIRPWTKKRRKPSWVISLYDREAQDVSPILIDIERGRECNHLDTIMALVNAAHPQLGISFIETELSLHELHAHLFQFIFVKAEDETELTLRFADCAVLPALAETLTVEQWSFFVGPLSSWKIHGRDGKLNSLPILKAESEAGPPLVLSNVQITKLKEAMGADLLLFNLRKLRPDQSSEYTTLDAYERAQQTRKLWLSAGHTEDVELILFAREVFDSEGRLLLQPGLRSVLEHPDPVVRRKDLHRMASLRSCEV
jgi:hypothetical protein